MLRAAITLADAEGIDALNMRRLARSLGVEASLQLLGLGSGGRPGAAGLRGRAPPRPSPGGFSNELSYHGFHALQSHVSGFTLYVLSFQFDREELQELAAAFLRDFPAEEYPDLAGHIRQHMEPSDEHQRAFEFGLDLILDGLERLRDRSTGRTTTAASCSTPTATAPRPSTTARCGRAALSVDASQAFYEELGPRAGFSFRRRSENPDRAQFTAGNGSFSVVAGASAENVHLAFAAERAETLIDPDGNTVELSAR